MYICGQCPVCVVSEMRTAGEGRQGKLLSLLAMSDYVLQGAPATGQQRLVRIHYLRHYQPHKSKEIRSKKERENEREVKADLSEGEHWLQ